MIRILACAHDAGGANILAYLIKNNLQQSVIWTVAVPTDSPANFIFKKILKTKKIKHLKWRGNFSFLAKQRINLVLVTTGHGGFELNCLKAAKKEQLPTVALLDHWKNYRERFGYPHSGWRDNLPDYFLLGDTLAWRLAKKAGFKNLLKIKNYYIFDILQQRNKFINNKAGGNNLLFLSEELVALRNGLGRRAYQNELKVLQKLIINFPKLKKKYKVKKFVIRLHPGETVKNKYDFLIKQYPDVNIVVQSNQVSFFSSLRRSALVVGKDTIGLLIACLLGKLTVSFNSGKINTILPIPISNKITNISQIFKIKKANQVNFTHKLFFAGKYDFKNILTEIL